MIDSCEIPKSSSYAGAGGASAASGFRFQALVGATFASSMLTESPLDVRLQLGKAGAVNIGFETDAPVDDILIATSEGGYVAVQAKKHVSLSARTDSAFNKAVFQFVGHWLKCRAGDGSLGWNRPLDPERDRLVLALSSDSPVTVRNDLQDALRKRSLGGGQHLSQAHKRALEGFETCVRAAWEALSTDELSPVMLEELYSLVWILDFDMKGTQRDLLLERIKNTINEGGDPSPAESALLELCSELSSNRRVVNFSSLRGLLQQRGIVLRMPKEYSGEIERLRQQTQFAVDRLKNHRRLEVEQGRFVTVARECQKAINVVASEGSFLVIGEPGSGKSSVMCGIAEHLLEKDEDVLMITVDQMSVATLEGLSKELRLNHSLLEVMEAWDGPGGAWLILDSLDAVRGGHGDPAFRLLIQKVLESKGRWRVIASIRSFDLRMGQQLRSLFKGEPYRPDFADSDFPQVNHFLVPSWSKSEFEELLRASSLLASNLEHASSALLKLLEVPFNTELACELMRDGAIAGLQEVSSQSDLLSRYWEHRIGGLGTPAETCLRRVVDHMLKHQSLNARKLEISDLEGEAIDALQGVGMLVPFGGGQWLQFRHHILFDYVASRVWLNPDTLISGQVGSKVSQSQGLMLAPATAFMLQELWDQDAKRAEFWGVLRSLLGDKHGDPILKSAAVRMGAELPQLENDTCWLADQSNGGDEGTIEILICLCRTLGASLDKRAAIALTPWTKLVASLSLNDVRLADVTRVLLYRLIGRSSDEQLRSDLGIAARRLLDFGYRSDFGSTNVRSAIGFVARTYSTEPAESRRLLSRVFDHERLESFAWEEVPEICRNIESIAAADPDFVVEIYKHTYSHEVIEDHKTQWGTGRILAFTSSARQDFKMARYSLNEYYPSFLERHPRQAALALVDAIDGFSARNHPVMEGQIERRTTIHGKEVRLQPDGSYVWASEPEPDYPEHAEEMLVKVIENLKACDEDSACRLAALLVQRASSALIWSRLFMVAAMRSDALSDFLLPYALSEPFLVELDTRKDAIDLVSASYESLSEKTRCCFEQSAFEFDFSCSASPEEAKVLFLRRLFFAIGEERLSTDQARAFFSKDIGGEEFPNTRLVQITDFEMESPSPSLYRIEGVDISVTANERVKEQIELVSQTLAIPSDSPAHATAHLQDVLREIGNLADAVSAEGMESRLKLEGEDAIGDACKRVVSIGLISNDSPESLVDEFIELVSLAAGSDGPEVRDDTERAFEESPMYESPAARTAAAQAILGLLRLRPELGELLTSIIDMLLADPHPAVRMQAGRHLLRIYNTHRSLFWEWVRIRLELETNLGVIEFLMGDLLGRVANSDPESVEEALLKLMDRFKDAPDKRSRLHRKASRLLALLWIRFGKSRSRFYISQWASSPDRFDAELGVALGVLRGSFVAGLRSGNNRPGDPIRHRAFEFAEGLVKSIRQRELELSTESNGDQLDEVQMHNLQTIENGVCTELRFSIMPADAEEGASDSLDLDKFLNDAEPLMRLLGESKVSSTIHELLALTRHLLPIAPESVFDIVANAVLDGGRKAQYQFEDLGKDLLIDLIAVILADYKEILASRDQRTSLVKCLALFADAGWPEAQELLYRLPEMVR